MVSACSECRWCILLRKGIPDPNHWHRRGLILTKVHSEEVLIEPEDPNERHFARGSPGKLQQILHHLGFDLIVLPGLLGEEFMNVLKENHICSF